MRRFVEGIDRGQATLFPECLEDWIDADNPVRVIDAFVEKLDLSGLGFDGVDLHITRGPAEALHLRLPQSAHPGPKAADAGRYRNYGISRGRVRAGCSMTHCAMAN
jgi:hypothetical protein